MPKCFCEMVVCKYEYYEAIVQLGMFPRSRRSRGQIASWAAAILLMMFLSRGGSDGGRPLTMHGEAGASEIEDLGLTQAIVRTEVHNGLSPLPNIT